ncbi:hypothetical protein CXB51_025277 [Gossypium anomalum]|uniref:Uncharacterized protein n=1 Tax=Gossypium anomalum TaxID=47600 RepID=A0A8J5YDX4_9ROSI|nr:hypothetical protein CXB51_025277 [Gossypium anomalum]
MLLPTKCLDHLFQPFSHTNYWFINRFYRFAIRIPSYLLSMEILPFSPYKLLFEMFISCCILIVFLIYRIQNYQI